MSSSAMREETKDLIGAFLIAAMLITWLLADIAEYLVVRRLRRDHPDLWVDLGSPGRRILGRQADYLSPWLKRRGYESLDDAGFVRLCRRVRIFSVARVPCFFAAFIAGIVLVSWAGHLHWIAERKP